MKKGYLVKTFSTVPEKLTDALIDRCPTSIGSTNRSCPIPTEHKSPGNVEGFFYMQKTEQINLEIP